MKRDMDLWRKLLLEVEASDTYSVPFAVEIEGYSQPQIWYHTMQLHEAGLLEAVKSPATYGDSGTEEEWYAKTLTPAGHDFLDAARNPTLWERGKTIAQEQAGVLTLEALKISLTLAVQRAFGQNDAG